MIVETPMYIAIPVSIYRTSKNVSVVCVGDKYSEIHNKEDVIRVVLDGISSIVNIKLYLDDNGFVKYLGYPLLHLNDTCIDISNATSMLHDIKILIDTLNNKVCIVNRILDVLDNDSDVYREVILWTK